MSTPASRIEKLIAEAQSWIAAHRQADRKIEEAAGYIRLKALQEALAAVRSGA